MKSYEFDPEWGLVDVETGIATLHNEPKPGEGVDFGGTRLMAVEDNGESCNDCAVYEGNFQLCMENSKKKDICTGTFCDGVYRRDRKSIHYEEVKDEERV